MTQTPMASRSPAAWFDPDAGHALPSMKRLPREVWLACYIARLSELRPGEDQHRIASSARDLWPDLASFDPVIAAEMEYEENAYESDPAGETQPTRAVLRQHE